MFTNTDKFSETANYFKKYGIYTKDIVNTLPFNDFWDEEYNRCLNGYTINSTKITGRHYFYLNYNRIRITDPILKKKYDSFPRFYDSDKEFFDVFDKAREKSKGLIVAKSRRKGYSFKNASNVLYNYHFQRGSCNCISAFLEEYAADTMSKALHSDNFISRNTAFGKRRLVKSKDHIVSGFSYKDASGTTIEQGYKSEILRLVFYNNPDASIGKSVDLMLFEEAGKWKNLKECFSKSEPLFKDGDIMTGMPVIFGTGGDMEEGSVDFSEMFYNPDLFNFLAFDNEWDEELTGSKCGYFIPDYLIRPPFIDDDGNSDVKGAKESESIKRKKFEESGDKIAYETHISQYPFSPSEAFLTSASKYFPQLLLQDQINKIIVNKELNSIGLRGKLEWENADKVKWVTDLKLTQAPYPTDNNDRKGCITIYEHPCDIIPANLYVAGLDPYTQDQASSSDSLGACYIYKRFNTFTEGSNIIVAEYVGRPDTANEYYDNLLKLLTYYKCKCLHENMSRDVISYFAQKRKLSKLYEEPTLLKSIQKDYVSSRGYGMPMNKYIKAHGEQYIYDWLVTERTPGVLNLNTIYSIPLLKELKSYDRKKNTDRVMALMFVMYQLNEDYHIKEIKKVEDKKDNSFDKLFKHFRQYR